MVATDAVFENDSMKFVYLGKDIPVKQVVWLGDENENNVLVKKGLKQGDVVWLTEPTNAAELKLVGTEIYQEIKKGKDNAKALVEKERQEFLKKHVEPLPPAGQRPTMPAGLQVK